MIGESTSWQSQFSCEYRAHMIILFIVKVENLQVFEWSYMSPWQLPWIKVSWMVNNFWARSPIYMQRIYAWCSFLDPHPTIHHSNDGVRWDDTGIGSHLSFFLREQLYQIPTNTHGQFYLRNSWARKHINNSHSQFGSPNTCREGVVRELTPIG